MLRLRGSMARGRKGEGCSKEYISYSLIYWQCNDLNIE